MPENAAEVLLKRTVRFCANLNGDKDLHAPRASAEGRPNTFSAWPGMIGLGAYYEIDVTCRGWPDPTTGYLLNISAIDRAVRSRAVPVIQRAIDRCDTQTAANVLQLVLHEIREELGPIVESALWRLTPYYSLTMAASTTDRVSMTQSCEFSAAHRRHVESLDVVANRATFGKCNNPSGHGHNYRVDVTIAVVLGDAPRFTLRDGERIVAVRVIDRFDHKPLNRDTAEFANVNPSVENIARVCHGLLEEAIADAGCELRQVTVWETEKTCCSYPAR